VWTAQWWEIWACQLQPSQVQTHPSSTIIPSSVSPPPLATTVPSNANIRGAYGGGNGNLKRQAHGTPDSAPAIKHRVTNGYYASSAMAPTSKSGEGASHVAQPGPSTPVSTVSTSSDAFGTKMRARASDVLRRNERMSRTGGLW